MSGEATGEVVVPLSKTKIALLLPGAVGFVLASIWIWLIADTQERYNPLFMKTVAATGEAFFGLCAIYALIKIFDSRPGLVVDSEGIIDNSSAVAAGRIFWHKVIGIRVSHIAGQRFITIDVAAEVHRWRKLSDPP